MNEIWKDIIGYKGLYQISNLCRLKVLTKTVYATGKKPYEQKESILGGSLNNNGYLVFTLYKNKKKKGYPAHRLLALHFLPNPENKPQINHIDGNKLNNSLNNIEWCTIKENAVHAFKTGLRVNPKGEAHGGSKLTDEKVIEIINKYKTGLISYRQLGVEYGVSSFIVYSIVRRKSWSHVTLKTA